MKKFDPFVLVIAVIASVCLAMGTRKGTYENNDISVYSAECDLPDPKAVFQYSMIEEMPANDEKYKVIGIVKEDYEIYKNGLKNHGFKKHIIEKETDYGLYFEADYVDGKHFVQMVWSYHKNVMYILKGEIK